MTPEQLEIAKAFEQVAFKPNSADKEFADRFMATARKSPGTELNDKQDRFVRDLAFRYRRNMPVGLVLAQVQHGYSTLQWMAPELARSGVIKNEPWVPESARRAVALFPNKSLQPCAALMAALHPFAIEYITLAPVIVLAVAQGSILSKVIERKRVSKEWTQRFSTDGKFRERNVRPLMADAGLSYALRKLHPSVLECNQWDTIQALCTIDGSTLSQIIPAREDQKEWLNSIGHWTAQMHRRFQNRALHFEWACRQLNPDNMRRGHQDVRDVLNNVANIADFAGHNPLVFNDRWTLDRALAETRRWHDEMARATHEQKYFLENGKAWDEPIDYIPFPRQVRLGVYQFTALQSGKELFEEGRDMHHCVGSYSKDVISGRSRIYHMHDSDLDKRIATIEFSHEKFNSLPALMNDVFDVPYVATAEMIHQFDDRRYRPRWHMVQAKGPYNAALTKDAYAAIVRFTERLNYYWAMFEHERKRKADYEHRLAMVMANPTPTMIIAPGEFPHLDLSLLDRSNAIEAPHAE